MFGLNVELKRDDFVHNFENVMKLVQVYSVREKQTRCFPIVLLVIFR